MAKRSTGVGKMKKSHSKKTQKRLAIKRKMLTSRQNRLTKRTRKRRK